MLPLQAHITLYNLSEEKSWTPLCDNQWICLKIYFENEILRLLMSSTDHFDDIILQSKIKKSSQWILVADDFAEFEDQVGHRYGMYFESQEVAEKFTATVASVMIDRNNSNSDSNNNNQQQQHEHEHGRQMSADIVNLGLELKSSSIDTLPNQNTEINKSNSQSGPTRKTNRRKSLAEFQEINDAVGNALNDADGAEANFNKAVGEQIVALNEKPRKSEVDLLLEASDDDTTTPTRPISYSLPPPPSTAGTCRLGETRRASVDNAETFIISAPTVVKHNVQVRFNEDYCRYEGLPIEWKHQNKQFGVPYEALQKKSLEGYSQNIPLVLIMLKKHLFENNGHLSVGIFRLAPEKDECQRIKNQIDQGEYAGCSDVNVLANLIKVFFRELPINLLNLIPDESIHKIARLSIPDTIIEMGKVFGTNYEIIYWLLDLMAEVVLHEDVNKMSVKNMAIVMSPNLYAVTTENAMVALTMAQRVAEFTTNILHARLKSKYNYEARS